MELLTTVRNAWERYQIVASDTVVLGISGGVDSMVLFDLVRQLHPTDRTIVAHVDHGMRAESSGDAEFVRTICERYGMIFEGTQVDIRAIATTGKTSVEAAGRTVRYGFFEKVRELHRARFILTAHHRDDSIETVLINLIRGARLRGLSGMMERQDSLLRPLLPIAKADLLAFALANGIEYREDSTNGDSEYVRNRVRNDILPQMEIINPMVRDTLADFAEYARSLDRMVEWLLAVHLSGNSIHEDDFAKLPELLQLSFIEKVYASIHGGTIGLSGGNMDEVRRFILEARGGTVKELGDLRLEKKERKIRWGSKRNT